jgi:hypothetical protein
MAVEARLPWRRRARILSLEFLDLRAQPHILSKQLPYKFEQLFGAPLCRIEVKIHDSRQSKINERFWQA